MSEERGIGEREGANSESTERSAPNPMKVTALAGRTMETIQKVVRGQEEAVQNLMVALVCGGHVLLEGVPGVAKTLVARSMAAALSCSFSRIQFTPDLMPSDVTGVNVFDPKSAEFRFRPGPLFSEFVLADEINRAPAKTQAALLEAMQERQVSLDGESHALPELFTVVATQNPVEYEGTYPLPEAQLDRFLLKIVVDYPEEPEELEMLRTLHGMGNLAWKPEASIQAVGSVAEILEARRVVYETRMDESVMGYVLGLIRGSRQLSSLSLGASPRAGVMLMHASKALAALRGKDYVTPDEVKDMAIPVLRHRLALTPEAEIEGLGPDDCIQRLLENVPIPR